ncbi:hypothetical protein CUR178_08265 [Leishmania enriettii]|uniref:Uncharacterized protein n=1 Tax=Leishmania enriettii TaxID=5663 RepID=A0A836HW11_LEIEN|nr:hypothetical protein CUR178_08265 [Leishmania enriettii]
MRLNHSTTAAGAPVSPMLTARVSSPFANGASEKPPKQSKSRQACPPEPKAVAGTEDTVRNAKGGRGGTCGSGRAGQGRLPPPLAVAAEHRNSRYRRQRVRHPPADISVRRRQGYHRRGGVGGGVSHSPCSSFMQQRLLCVRLNDKLTYIDPKCAPPGSRGPVSRENAEEGSGEGAAKLCGGRRDWRLRCHYNSGRQGCALGRFCRPVSAAAAATSTGLSLPQ